mmetsp:Transcript_10598/g.26743  ORF Transcript_10598/g.26743 Transcript_10598/m.26743 type:complete len:207 (+) Transcript_10598:2620-3240(+)
MSFEVFGHCFRQFWKDNIEKRNCIRRPNRIFQVDKVDNVKDKSEQCQSIQKGVNLLLGSLANGRIQILPYNRVGLLRFRHIQNVFPAKQVFWIRQGRRVVFGRVLVTHRQCFQNLSLGLFRLERDKNVRHRVLELRQAFHLALQRHQPRIIFGNPGNDFGHEAGHQTPLAFNMSGTFGNVQQCRAVFRLHGVDRPHDFPALDQGFH